MLLGGNASFGPHDEVGDCVCHEVVPWHPKIGSLDFFRVCRCRLTLQLPQDGLFHFCGDTLMAVRIGEYKLKYYSEQLPFDNYSQVHCTHGWAHGEFFQGGWDCHGGSVTTLNPPQLLRISSDPAERYSLLDADTWHAHLQWLTGQRRLYNATRGTPHSLLHHGIRGSDSKSKLSIFSVTDDQCPSIINGSVSPASIVTVPGGILKGYAGASLPLPANSSTNELLGACVRRCCEDGSCAAAVMQDVSRNQGEPPGSCALGQPCCWLVDFEHADLPPTPEVNGETVHLFFFFFFVIRQVALVAFLFAQVFFFFFSWSCIRFFGCWFTPLFRSHHWVPPRKVAVPSNSPWSIQQLVEEICGSGRKNECKHDT